MRASFSTPPSIRRRRQQTWPAAGPKRVPLAVHASALQVSPDELKAAILLFYASARRTATPLVCGLGIHPCRPWRRHDAGDFLGLDAHTVARGRQQLLDQDVVSGRMRRGGGGPPFRGKKTARPNRHPASVLLEHDTAGDPMTGLRWSRRTTAKIAEALGDLASPSLRTRSGVCSTRWAIRSGSITSSSPPIPAPIATSSSNISADLRQHFQRRDLPIISVDTKKRELVGNFKNPGRVGSARPASGLSITTSAPTPSASPFPMAFMTSRENRGAFVVGVSHDTPAFAAHAIAHWWHQEGSQRYAGSRQTAHSGRYRRQQRLPLSRLENRTPDPTRQCLWPRPHRGPLSHRRVQMEPHRASPLLGNLQKLGR